MPPFSSAERRSRWSVGDPLARFGRLHTLPLREGESRRRRQGVGHTPSRIRVEHHGLQPWLQSSAAPRLRTDLVRTNFHSLYKIRRTVSTPTHAGFLACSFDLAFCIL